MFPIGANDFMSSYKVKAINLLPNDAEIVNIINKTLLWIWVINYA